MWKNLTSVLEGRVVRLEPLARRHEGDSSRPRRTEDLALDALRRRASPGDVSRLARGRPGCFGGRDGGRFRHRGRGHGGAYRQYPLSRPSSRAQGAGDRVDLARARVLADRRERRGEALDAGARLRGSRDACASSSRPTPETSARARPWRPSRRSSRASSASTCSCGAANAATPPTTASSTTSGPRSGKTSGEGWTLFGRRPDERGWRPGGATQGDGSRGDGTVARPRRGAVRGGARAREHGGRDLRAHAARTRRRRTPATSCTWSSAEPESSSTGPSATPSARATCLFVPAGVEHRFEDFTDDLAVWVVFYGPEGGEAE